MKLAKASQEEIDTLMKWLQAKEGTDDPPPPFMRVVFGYETLLGHCCDPAASTLEWKPGIRTDKERTSSASVDGLIEVFKESTAHREQQFEVGQRALLERALKVESELEMLRERECKCPTMLEAEARALVRALQEIADATGMLPTASPAQIVNRVRYLMQNCRSVTPR
jgi:hypothetical protein